MKTREVYRLVEDPVVARKRQHWQIYNYMTHGEFTLQCASRTAVFT